MSKQNNDFFVKKKVWSNVKDELLGCYLAPYMAKILMTQRPIVYVDCFAGKGKFDDGNPGSPLIALDIIAKSISTTRAKNPIIKSHFIDLNYAEDLKNNLSGYNNFQIISGKFEDNIQDILYNKRGWNVFLYIDPYGIKALQSSLFDNFANGQFNTIELLINMNSFGFIREGCRALGVVFKENDIFEDLVEYDSTQVDTSNKSINDLNEIAGGDYWQKIIIDYKNRLIDGYEAENIFTNLYCKRMRESYKYVLNMPLRLKEGQRPKYRLIHATQHRDGCLIMVDNMINRWQAVRDIQNGGQLSFFDTNMNEESTDSSYLYDKVTSFFQKFTTNISINDAIAEFFTENGVIASTSDVRNVLKDFEKQNIISVLRSPGTTISGKPTRFMDENKKQKVNIRWN